MPSFDITPNNTAILSTTTYANDTIFITTSQAGSLAVGWIVSGWNVRFGRLDTMYVAAKTATTLSGASGYNVQITGSFDYSGDCPYTFSPPSSVACFVEGTQILTQDGYKAIETLKAGHDLVVTSDNRRTSFKLLKTRLDCANALTAPYVIQAGAFGKNLPLNPLRVSPTHKIQVPGRKGLWVSAESAASKNPMVQQYGVGEPVSYYHIQCPNFMKDNVIAEGLVTESFGTIEATNGVSDIYTWNTSLYGFTRTGYGSINKA